MSRYVVCWVLALLVPPGPVWAVEAAPALTDREIVERLTLALLGAFSALVAAIIGFALWDRRTMIRPFERTVTSLAEELSANRQRMEALLDALRALGQRDPAVANVLKQFNLL